MTSITQRHAAAAFVLTLLLGSYAVPATAQPRRSTAGQVNVERDLLSQVWLWLDQLWSSGSTLERMRAEDTAGPGTSWGGTDSAAASTSSRGMTIDPNGI
jgi:hypothetical protein